ncbi:MAG: hypothetical protein ABI416_04915 [Ginsengibacter sp.]
MNANKIGPNPAISKAAFHTNGIVTVLPPTFYHIPEVAVDVKTQVTESLRGFRFQAFYQPYIELLLQTLNDQGLYALFNSGLLVTTDEDTNGNGTTFNNVYSPNIKQDPDALVQQPLPVEKFNFEICKPFAMDNWFTFYHLIIFIVETLLANNKNDEAIQWIENCLYDPKAIAPEADPKATNANTRFWKLPVFKKLIEENTTKFFNDTSTPCMQHLMASLNKDPFNPFLVAYYRPQEFMMYVVVLYVKAHVAQGDVNFRTAYNGGGMDYLNLALEYYKIAKIQLGDGPQTVPNVLKKKPETYQSLKAKKLDENANAKVQYENIFPFCSQASLNTDDTSTGSLLGGGLTFYFSIPPDKNMLELYDLIDDRLFKLRNCEDIDGIIRKIDLFGTPINPAQLLSALAKGLTLGQILGGLYSPAPIYRFNFLLQKAVETCNEVKSLGGTIVSALEKSDAEQLSHLRAINETNILNRLTPVKERQVFESRMQKQILLKSRDTSKAKLVYYQSLIGASNQIIPEYSDLPTAVDDNSKLPDDTVLSPALVSVDVTPLTTDERGVTVIPKEQVELAFLNKAAGMHDLAGEHELTAAIIHAVPDLSLHTAPFGGGITLGYGAANIAAIYSAFARDAQNEADKRSHIAMIAAKLAGYIRREYEWVHQVNLVEKEIIQIDQQLAAADVRIQIAQQELANHKIQIIESQQVQDFMIIKESNYLNYQQVVNGLKPIHKNFYDLAMYYARSAEQAYQFEKPGKVIDFISYNYDNSIVGCSTVADGLLSSLRTMEKSYLNDSARPLEMKIHIQLSRLDPLALLQLRKSGSATIKIPEWLLLLKNRGIYNAKWISVNFTFPMVTGPYINMNAVVTMQHNFIRITDEGVGNLADFEIKSGSDERFVENNTPFKEIIVSTGMSDQGYNLDQSATANEIYQQQYHPFVHAGFQSEWNIDLNSKTKEYDYSEINWDSLADVIISGVVSVEIGSNTYRKAAENYLTSSFAQLAEQPLMLFLEIKRDFSNELYKFKSGSNLQPLTITFDASRFPYLAQNKKITITGLSIITADELSTNKVTLDNSPVGFKKEGSVEIDNYNIFNSATQNVDAKMNIVLNHDPLKLTIDFAKSKDKDFAGDSYIVVEYKIESKEA